MIHIDPVAHAPRQILPHVFVLKDRLAAFGIEPGDTIFLDFAFVLQAEPLFDFDFYR